MPFQHETGRAVGADRLGQSSFLDRIDGRDSNPNRAELQARNRMRRQRLVEHLHRLGPAALGHFVNEVECGASIPDHLERYARIDSDFVRALGGDRFAPVLHVIAGSSRS
jgi:hypothetical protein